MRERIIVGYLGRNLVLQHTTGVYHTPRARQHRIDGLTPLILVFSSISDEFNSPSQNQGDLRHDQAPASQPPAPPTQSCATSLSRVSPATILSPLSTGMPCRTSIAARLRRTRTSWRAGTLPCDSVVLLSSCRSPAPHSMSMTISKKRRERRRRRGARTTHTLTTTSATTRSSPPYRPLQPPWPSHAPPLAPPHRPSLAAPQPPPLPLA